MFRHGSRSLSLAVHGRFPRRPLRITIQVIRSAAKTAMNQARTSCNVPFNVSRIVELVIGWLVKGRHYESNQGRAGN